ncbi:MAG: glycosyltransferase [Candidatus Krumholzibacteria bacterium]|nr:glycosyltransferase [Candidatus Krumholzibacteria bacterium]
MITAATDKPVVAVYVRHYLSPSETFVYRQLQGVRRAYHPIVLTANPHNLDLFPFEPLFHQRKTFVGRVYTRILQNAAGRYAVLTPQQAAYWRRVLTESTARLIHAHFGHFALDMLPVARSLKIPMVVTFHGYDASVLLANKKYLRALRELADYARVITVSQDMAERLAAVGVKPVRLSVHYIGVPVQQFEYVQRMPIKEKLAAGMSITFVQVSNFVEKKGHKYTVEAFSKLVARRANVKLVFAGDGPLRPSIESLCVANGISDKVTFVGKVVTKEVVSLMAEADVFLHHSVTTRDGDKEGLPTVLMEAMATGLPAISTIHSGIPELIEDGVDGFLVRERDVDDYVAKLTSVADIDSDMSNRARKKVETSFNMSLQNDKLIDIYQRAIDENAV